MGLDVGVITGDIKYLDRSAFADLHDFLIDLWAMNGSSNDGNAFVFVSREDWDEMVDSHTEDMEPADAAAFRQKTEAFFKLAEALSPDRDEFILHANW